MCRCRLIGVFLLCLGLMVSSRESFAQVATGPQIWTHTFPGQSQPSVFGYGTPPTGRGPLFSFSGSPLEMALAEAVMNMTGPLRQKYIPQQGGGFFQDQQSPYGAYGQDPYAGAYASTDPYQGALGAAPGWSGPFDVNPVIRPHTPPSQRPGSVFMP